MEDSRWKTVERVFNKSVLLPPEKREEYVFSACGADAALAEDVLTLLAETEKNENFLSEPLFEIGAQILASEFVGLFDEPNFASYEVQKIIGRGGSGVVFLARDTVLERHVALKVLPTALSDSDERILRFQQEAKAASAISHPNVAHIYGFGKANSRYYLAMEYVRGKTLRELIKEKSIDKIKALEIAGQVAKALSAAHKAGIVHRDIKPENIIVTDDDLVKVLDFGLAKPFLPQTDSGHRSFNSSLDTKPGMIIGTTAYMSPEQIRGKALDLRTDIWSLGVVLYEMLARRRPFVGDTPSDVQALILLSEPEYNADVAAIPEMKSILAKMLAKNADERYRDTIDLIKDLGNIQRQLSKNSHEDIYYSFAPFAAASDGLQPKTVEINSQTDKSIAKISRLYSNPVLLAAGLILLIVVIGLFKLFF
ncbi:MAG TPA: serine/threonine-protein kinase [Pyrinomonadaceae bacterium]|jgi:serine/threonine protein kinase